MLHHVAHSFNGFENLLGPCGSWWKRSKVAGTCASKEVAVCMGSAPTRDPSIVIAGRKASGLLR